MALQFPTTLRNTWLDALDDAANAGSGAAVLEVRTGSPPANCAAADSGTLLATLTMSDPAFAAASGGVMEEATITADASADASGTPGHFRLKDSTGAVVMQGTAGVGSGDLNFNSTISAGGQVSCSNFQITSGGA